jgi:hypothetical protein
MGTGEASASRAEPPRVAGEQDRHAFLEYIEEDRFAFLPPPVYLRGFLQEYARLVGLDPREVADRYLERIA